MNEKRWFKTQHNKIIDLNKYDRFEIIFAELCSNPDYGISVIATREGYINHEFLGNFGSKEEALLYLDEIFKALTEREW